VNRQDNFDSSKLEKIQISRELPYETDFHGLQLNFPRAPKSYVRLAPASHRE